MKKIWLTIVFAVIPILVAPSVGARTVGGIDVPDRAQIGGQGLILNGSGMRTKFFFDIYVCGLYLPKTAHSTDAVLAEPGPKRVLMHFVYHRVSRRQLVDAWNEGFEANTTEAQRAALQKRIHAFNALFGDAPKGQVVVLDYTPGKGTSISIDGQMKGTIAGKDFSDALLRIWLGDHPVTGSLKRALLGG